MILLNLPIPTLQGWSHNFNKRILNGLLKYPDFKSEILTYPYYENSYDESNRYLQSIILEGGVKSLDYLYKNREYLQSLEDRIKSVIFFDASQSVEEQIHYFKNFIFINNNTIKYYVLFYIDPSYLLNNVEDIPKSYYDKARLYDNVLFGNIYSLDNFNTYFGEKVFKKDVNAHIIGGILEKNKDINKISKLPNSIFWAGRFSNKLKNFTFLLNIIKKDFFKDYIFYVCVDIKNYATVLSYKKTYKNLEVILVNNAEEYIDVSSKCKFVLSTAKCETFGYAVFDAVANLCYPILPNINSSYKFFDEQYLYNNIEDIKQIIQNYTYEKAYYNYIKVQEFTANNFFNRLLKL